MQLCLQSVLSFSPIVSPQWCCSDGCCMASRNVPMNHLMREFSLPSRLSTFSISLLDQSNHHRQHQSTRAEKESNALPISLKWWGEDGKHFPLPPLSLSNHFCHVSVDLHLMFYRLHAITAFLELFIEVTSNVQPKRRELSQSSCNMWNLSSCHSSIVLPLP